MCRSLCKNVLLTSYLRAALVWFRFCSPATRALIMSYARGRVLVSGLSGTLTTDCLWLRYNVVNFTAHFVG